MPFVFADIERAVEAWNIQLDSQVTFGQLLRTNVADESEAVAELEVGLSDDVAFEARGCRDSEIATIADGEDQFLAAGDSGRDGLGRRGAAT